jgi:hypothetical protein
MIEESAHENDPGEDNFGLRSGRFPIPRWKGPFVSPFALSREEPGWPNRSASASSTLESLKSGGEKPSRDPKQKAAMLDSPVPARKADCNFSVMFLSGYNPVK